MNRISIIILFLFVFLQLKSQPTNGTTGLLNIPSAEMQKDGTFFTGANFLPTAITPDTWDYNTANYFMNITFFPFMEISYRMTLFKLNENNQFNNQDRSLAVRFQLFREKKYIPALVFGVNDFYASNGKITGNRYFSNMYFVATKNLNYKNNLLSTTLGFFPQVSETNNSKGFFGGIALNPVFLPDLKLMVEYDTFGVNAGAGILIFKHLYLYGMAHELKRFAAGFSYSIYLKT